MQTVIGRQSSRTLFDNRSRQFCNPSCIIMTISSLSAFAADKVPVKDELLPMVLRESPLFAGWRVNQETGHTR